MREMKEYLDIHQAYLGTIEDVLDNSDYECSPRGQKILEKTDYSFRVTAPISEPIITRDSDRNKKIAQYTKKEIALYNSGSNSVIDFATASKFWEKIANPDLTINSAYGHLIWFKNSQGNPLFEDCGVEQGMRTPWQWAKESLIRDKDTRQAIMMFALPEHRWLGNKDQVCTLHGNWSIRNDNLNLSIVMRSNDLHKGLVYDLAWFVSLMDKMIDELKQHYPNLHKGHYTHTAHSMHIYEKDIPDMLKMIGRS